jgi:NADPH2:quinone reductase
VAGVVDAIGDDVVDFQEGQAVAALIQYRGYAQYANVLAGQVVPVPDGLDPAEVVCLTVGYLTAYQIFHHVAKLVPGQRVLIHGAAGGTGSAMLDLGRQMGLEVYGTASKPKHDLVASLGATPINYHHDDFVRNICEFTSDGVDLVVDPIGGPNLSRSFETLRPGGLLVSTAAISAVRGDVTPMAAASAMVRLPIWNALPNKKKAMAFDVVRYSRDHLEDYHEDLKQLMDLLAAGQIEPVIGSRFPLEEARQAQELLLDFGAQGKVVLIDD